MDTDVFLNNNNKMNFKKRVKKEGKSLIQSIYIFLFPALLSNYGNLSHGWNIIK